MSDFAVKLFEFSLVLSKKTLESGFLQRTVDFAVEERARALDLEPLRVDVSEPVEIPGTGSVEVIVEAWGE